MSLDETRQGNAVTGAIIARYRVFKLPLPVLNENRTATMSAYLNNGIFNDTKQLERLAPLRFFIELFNYLSAFLHGKFFGYFKRFSNIFFTLRDLGFKGSAILRRGRANTLTVCFSNPDSTSNNHTALPLYLFKKSCYEDVEKQKREIFNTNVERTAGLGRIKIVN